MSEPAPPDPSDSPPPEGPAPLAVKEGVSGKVVVIVGLVLFVLLLSLRFVLSPVFDHFIGKRQAANRMVCAQNLRAIGAAAQAYAQDQRAFPHIRGAKALDGPVTSNEGSQVWRLLLARGDLADPTLYVCPAKPRIRGRDPKRGERALWLKEGQGEAPALSETRELSYGWTRRALAPNAKASRLLAADKGVVAKRGQDGPIKGNHTQGWTLLAVDGSVRFVSIEDEPFPGSWLAKTSDPERDGYLGIRDQDLATSFRFEKE